MRGRFYSFALIGLAVLPGAQPRADLLQEFRETAYSVTRPVAKTAPINIAPAAAAAATAPSAIAVVTAHAGPRAIAVADANLIASDVSALALQAAFAARPGKSLESQAPANGVAAASDEPANSWLDLGLMLCLMLGLLAYPLVRKQTALRQSSKLAS